MSAFGWPPPNDPGLQPPASSVTALSPGSGQAVHPTVLLDTYYDSAIYANKSAAINAAIAAAQALNGELECRTGRVYSLDTTYASIAPTLPFRAKFHGATWQANYGKPMIVKLDSTADYQTFTDITIDDPIFDANNQTGFTTNICVFGNLDNSVIEGPGAAGRRCNVQRLKMNRPKFINTPVANGTAACQNFRIQSRHLASGETQTNLIDIRLNDAYAIGGSNGAVVVGTGAATVEVFHDQIYLEIEHDVGVVPSAVQPVQSGNVQICGSGFGEYCEVRINGKNGSDTGVEIDTMQTSHIWGTLQDTRNAAVFVRNFRAPIDAFSQIAICHGVKTRIINLNPDTSAGGNGYVAVGFAVGHTTPNPTFGEFVLEDCSYYSQAANFRRDGLAFQAQATLVNRITIVGKFTATFAAINDATGTGGSAFYVGPATTGSVVFGGGGSIVINLAGTSNAAMAAINGVVITPAAGCTVRLDLGDIDMSSSLASAPVGATRALVLGLTGVAGGSVTGRIRRVGWGTFSGGDTAPKLILPLSSANITIQKRLIIDEADFTNDPTVAPGPNGWVNSSAGVDATNRAKIAFRSVQQGTYPIPAAGLSANTFAAGAFTTAVGNQYVAALPAEIQFAVGTGAGITAIDKSKDGTSYFNIYTQASGAMAQSVTTPAETGDFFRVTFATTQPTTSVLFRRAQ